ncbi:MAG TPA: helix-turn-helix transcriptional regulator [Myxococcales bacterium]|nr:helix-turn-helix transcriptional regulator [Myxococcales bacterium]
MSQPWFASIRREATRLTEWLEGRPAARGLLAGTLSRQEYVDFMIQTYHCARWTTWMLQAAAHRLSERGRNPELAQLLMGKLRENGGERWALSDLGALGWSEGLVLSTPPSPAVARCIEWSRRSVEHGSPVALLGTGYVLRFLSGRYAAQVARNLRRVDGIRGIRRAVRFLRGHAGTNAVELKDLEHALQWLTEPEDQRAALLAARATRRLCSAVLGTQAVARGDPPPRARLARRWSSAPRRLPPDPLRALRALMERLLRDQGVEVVCRFSDAELTRTRGATALFQRWFPEAAWRHGLPGELGDVMARLASAPPGVRESHWVRKGEQAVLGVTFVRVSRFCVVVVKEVPLAPPLPASWREVLTARELEVAARALQGLDYESIAERLGVKAGTVTKHMQHIFDKLGVPTRAKLHTLADEARALASAVGQG